MNRLVETQASLIATYSLYNLASKKNLPDMDVNNSENLVKLLEIIHRRETLAYVRKDKKSVPKEVTELKRLLADVLLLQDGFDIKTIKEKSSAAESID